MFLSACVISIRILPINLHRVLFVNKHCISNCANWVPAVARNATMSILVVENILMLPRLIAITPA